jgi:FMN phosphatase YigB (HAD superfamily)
MKNTLKILLICLLFAGCSAKKQNELKIAKDEKLTFIFDFDATMYNTKTPEKNIVLKKHRGYVDMLYESTFKGSGYQRNEVETWVAQNIHIANSPEGVNEFIRRLDDKFHIKVQQKDVNYAIS